MKLGKTYFSGSLTFDEGNNVLGPNTSNISGSFTGSLKGALTATGHILPDSNEVYDLGSTDKRFRDIYLSGSTIHLGAKTLSEQNLVTTDNASEQLAGSSIDGDFTVTGTITAQEFHTEFVSASIIYQSGSTQFGNSSDDTHIFTGTGSFDKIGIGTNTPSSELNIFHATDPELNFTINTHGIAGTLLADADGLKIYGKGSSNQLRFYSNTSEAVRIDSSGRIGIGTQTFGTNTGKLYVGGYLLNGSSAIAQFDGFIRLEQQLFIHDPIDNTAELQMLYSSTNGLSIAGSNGSGNVGIGIVAPSQALDVDGNIRTTSQLRIEAAPGDTIGGGPNVYLIGGTGASYSQIQQGTDKLDFWGFNGSAWGINMSIDNLNSRLGIRTESPDTRLHVRDSAITKYVDANTTVLVEAGEARLQLAANDDGNNGAGVIMSNANKHWVMQNRSTAAGGYLAFGHVDTTTTTDIIGDAMSNSPLHILPSGQIRINSTATNATAAQLIVGGVLSAGSSAIAQLNGFVRLEHGILIHYDSDNSKAGYISYGASGFSFSSEGVGASGNVGIGTTSPDTHLHVSSGAHTKLRVSTTATADASVEILGYDAGVHIGDPTNGNRWAIWNDGVSTTSSLKIGSYALGAWYVDGSQTLTIKSNGDVGIGYTDPVDRLQVAGNVRVPNGSAFKASYENSTDNYHASLEWAALQLGNNGGNRIVAGRTATGGSLTFYTNNTNNAADYTVTPDGVTAMIMTNTGAVRKPNNPAWWGYTSTLNSTPSTADYNFEITGLTELFDKGNNFNPTTGTFTAPVSGVYMVCVNIEYDGGITNGDWIGATITKNGGQYLHEYNAPGASRSDWSNYQPFSQQNSFLVELSANDYIRMSIDSWDGTGRQYRAAWGGYLVG